MHCCAFLQVFFQFKKRFNFFREINYCLFTLFQDAKKWISYQDNWVKPQLKMIPSTYQHPAPPVPPRKRPIRRVAWRPEVMTRPLWPPVDQDIPWVPVLQAETKMYLRFLGQFDFLRRLQPNVILKWSFANGNCAAMNLIQRENYWIILK